VLDFLRRTYGWVGDVTVEPGPRGALGRIWRVTAGGQVYALKEIFAEPPAEPQIAVEVDFVLRAHAAGVRAPLGRPDQTGRHIVVGPGAWFRLADWVAVESMDLAAPSTPAAVGELLARLHTCAPAASREPDGSPPDAWYDDVPPVPAFAALLGSGASWAPRLERVLPSLPQLCSVVTGVDASRMLLCHRDLHPGNVLAGTSDGAPVVVDWDNLGPADPSRELARALFDWWCDPVPDLEAMLTTYETYVRSGGPARLTSSRDFTMLVATRLNFLLGQLTVSIDGCAEPEQRDWAEQEIDESLRIMPAPHQFATVLGLLANHLA
jgi:Ser/Thr protein kinase RdoA (MazF antagonist)